MTNQAVSHVLLDFGKKLFTIRQAAEILTVSEETVRLWYHAGKLSGRKIGHGIRIDADSIRSLLGEGGGK